MKIAKLDTFIARIPYKHAETSSLINRGGVSDVIVKLTTEDGLVGWGECTRAADTSGIESAVKAMAPLVIGRSIWDTEVIQRDLAIHAVWAFQPMTGNFAYAGIDMALMDLCGKQRGQPIYRLLGGAMRDEVDYFYYMVGNAGQHLNPGKGRHAARLPGLLHQGRGGCGSRRRDARSAPRPDRADRQDQDRCEPGLEHPAGGEALKRWHHKFDIDFVEAPVPIDPVENMLDLRRLVDVPFCINEGLWREADAYRLIKSGAVTICATANIGSVRWPAFTSSTD